MLFTSMQSTAQSKDPHWTPCPKLKTQQLSTTTPCPKLKAFRQGSTGKADRHADRQSSSEFRAAIYPRLERGSACMGHGCNFLRVDAVSSICCSFGIETLCLECTFEASERTIHEERCSERNHPLISWNLQARPPPGFSRAAVHRVEEILSCKGP